MENKSRAKRTPTLADRLLAINDYIVVPRRIQEATQQSLMLAKKFVLSDEATRHMAEIVKGVPRIIADAQDFAIPPFTRMWVEFPINVFNEAVGARTTSEYLGEKNQDTLVGYLINGPSVRVGAWSQGLGKTAGFSTFEYMLNHPYKDIQEELRVCKQLGISRGTLDAMFWGSAANTFLAEGDRESLRALRENHSIWPLPLKDEITREKDPADIYAHLLNMAAGELRNIITILLFLNRTQDIQKHFPVPTEQGWVGNKRRAMLSHSVITIDVNPKPRFLEMVAGEGVWRRLHDVRGHFCHNKVARESGCMHSVWEETDHLQWKCPTCQGLRWWRKEHRRGHEDKGTVTSEYNVIASK
jgi:hypothetical protein